MVADIWAYSNVFICRPGGVFRIVKTTRKGTALDKKHLELLFKQLGFEVVIHENLKAQVGPNA